MPDRRRHRGPHPEDAKLFADNVHPTLREACADLSWLLERGYTATSAVKLVGDRYRLTQRQRTALVRSAYPASSAALRRKKQCSLAQLKDADLWVDGFNAIITVEAALSGGVILRGTDGAHRDLASVHGSYRGVQETQIAITLLLRLLIQCTPRSVSWVLDKPVSNSGWLLSQLQERGLELGLDIRRFDPDAAESAQGWRAGLANNPDRVVADAHGVAASSDSWVLDRCERWVDLPAELIGLGRITPWLVDLAGELTHSSATTRS